ncbi:glycosyltransferase [Pseudolactococcus yaeyamensis]
MKLVCIIDHGHYGGATQMLVWVANKMMEKGHDVKFLTFCSSVDFRGLGISEEMFIDFDFEERTATRKRKLCENISLIKKYRKFIKKEKPDFVLNFGDHSFYLGLLFRRFYKYKYIISERVDPNYSRGKNDVVRRFLYNFADGCIFQTEAAKSFFSKRLQDKSEVIFNPVKTKTEKFWTNRKTKKIISIGRLDFFQKRLDVLLEAFVIFHKKFPDYVLDIYGTGSEKDEKRLDELLLQYRLKHCVNLKGYTSNPIEALLTGEMFVMTSDFEGIPNTLIEALSIGMPVVATDCSPGGARLLLESLPERHLSQRGDVNGIASMMAEIASDEKTALADAKSLREALNQFSEDKISSQWTEAFEKWSLT